MGKHTMKPAGKHAAPKQQAAPHRENTAAEAPRRRVERRTPVSTASLGGRLPMILAGVGVLVVVIVLLAVLFGRKGEAKQEIGPDEPMVTEAASTGPLALYEEEQSFLISCIGDNTLWSSRQFQESVHGLPKVVGDDVSFPFRNTVQYFTEDEFTISNVECTFSDTKMSSSEQFYFLAPTKYAAILTEGGVDFVTTANNHMQDFGEAGAESTYAALDAVGIGYGKEMEAQIVTTENGLVLGIITAGTNRKPHEAQSVIEGQIAGLKEQGAEYIICMFHWGEELYYTPNQNQIDLAHAAIDAGANLVYGSHTHCLQPVEQYNDGLILYSMGNWCFGGNTNPTDPDTAIIQIRLHRDVYGNVTMEKFSAIPCCVSSNINAAQKGSAHYNDYSPTPYEEGSEAYERVISKLSGTYTAGKQGADYSDFYAAWG